MPRREVKGVGALFAGEDTRDAEKGGTTLHALKIRPMIKYQFFPRSIGITEPIKAIVDCFVAVDDQITSKTYFLTSDQVLAILRPLLLDAGMLIEAGKKADEKIPVPVLFGLDNRIDKAFYADGVSTNGKIVLEVEAGRAYKNYQFLKDIFQACMMYGVEYLVLAVRNSYQTQDDFKLIYSFLETMYISNRIILPLKGILLIGY